MDEDNGFSIEDYRSWLQDELDNIDTQEQPPWLTREQTIERLKRAMSELPEAGEL